MPAKSSDTNHLRLRIRNDTLKRLEKIAAANERTLTDEITRRLEQSLAADKALHVSQDHQEALQNIIQQTATAVIDGLKATGGIPRVHFGKSDHEAGGEQSPSSSAAPQPAPAAKEGPPARSDEIQRYSSRGFLFGQDQRETPKRKKG